jgi:hypothetical protein
VSELLVNTIKKADGTGALSVPAESGTVVTTASPSLGRRNLIINGAMQVAQRNTSTTTAGYLVDRWNTTYFRTDTLVATVSQSTDAPDGFGSSYKFNVDTIESLGGDEYVLMEQLIEAQNLQGLKYGTSSAQTITASFWVKSSETGTFAIHCYAQDGHRDIGVTYTINTADTWEYKTVNIIGDTAGTINNDNGEGFRLRFVLASGGNYTSTDNTSWGGSTTGRIAYNHNVNFLDTVNGYWQITGVQLEVGSVATPFEHRSYGEELALCQRYYYKIKADNNSDCLAMGFNRNTTAGQYFVNFQVQMRASPTALEQSGTAGDYQIIYLATSQTCSSVPTFDHATTHGSDIYFSASGLTAGQCSKGAGTNSSAFLAWSAEL